MANLEPVEFDLVLKEIPCKLNRPGQPPLEGKLVELDGTARDQWLNDMQKRMRYKADGSPAGMTTQEGTRANLISRCFIGNGGEKLSIADVQAFPSSVQAEMNRLCLNLCGLDKEAQEDSKND